MSSGSRTTARIRVGDRYLVMVGNNLSRVKIIEEDNGVGGWLALNEDTGCKIWMMTRRVLAAQKVSSGV